MNTPGILDLAHITPDGVITKMSNKRERHPEYPVEGYRAEFTMPLKEGQAHVFDALMSGLPGHARVFERSGFGQVALNAGDAKTTSMAIIGDAIVGETLVTHFNREKGELALETMRGLVGSGKHVPFGRVAMLPERSRLHKDAVQTLLRSGDLKVSPDAGIGEDGELLLPLEGMEYVFSDQLYTREALQALMMGPSARTLLKQHRRHPLPGRPKKLQANRFLVTGVTLETLTHHVFLRSIVQTRGVLSNVFHTEAVGLMAGRTQGGDRQFEIVNLGSMTEPTKSIRVMADVHRPAEIEKEGV